MIPCVLRERTEAPPGLDRAARLAGFAWSFHHTLRPYRPTPVRALPALAQSLGIGALWLKDESSRFGLGAFKALGASFAMHRYREEHDVGGDAVFTTATDGNHGRAVAWMARILGMRSVIYMPAHSVRARVEAIVNEGAQVVLVEEGYDAAVERAQAAGRTHGWIVIQDTTTPDYREIPEWIGAGYWTMARELESTINGADAPEVDLVVLHAGVGTWPAAMVQYFWHRYGARRPKIVIVEPVEAACVLESVRAGRPVMATGSLRTMMAGLNCGFPSLGALAVLRDSVDALIAIPDEWAGLAMRRLASGDGGDPVVVAGESGAASVAGLLALAADPDGAAIRERLQLTRESRVLVWSTEGATDPEHWARVVGRPVPA